jgi:predicted RNase H-like nuclease
LEVDIYLQHNPGAREIFFEVHPEVAFMALNQGMAVAGSKKTEEGRALRMDLVCGFFGHEALERVRAKFPRGSVLDDDILDAFAVLWTAERIQKGQHRVVPDPPQVDSVGLNMGIWY